MFEIRIYKRMFNHSLLSMILAIGLLFSVYNSLCEAHISQSEISIGQVKYGTSLNDIRRIYGEPDELTISGDRKILEYNERMRVTTYQDKVVSCVVKSSFISSSGGIKVGDSTSKVLSVFGKPDGYFGVVIRYTAIEDPAKKLEFIYKDNVITSISMPSIHKKNNTPYEGKMPSEQLALGGIRLNQKMSDVINIYGSPQSYRNRIAKYGNGLEIQYFEDNITSQIYEIRVTQRNGFATPAGIEIGMNESIIKKLYGEPDTTRITKVSKSYIYNGNGIDQLKYMKFVTESGIITGIYLHWAD